MIQHIIWDWNGTLVDDAWIFVQLMNEELSNRQLPLINTQTYRKKFTFPVKKYYENLGFDFQKESFEGVGYSFIQKYKKIKHEPLLSAETIEVLTKISKLNISQSIISAQENALLKESVGHYNLTHFFESIRGIDHYYADSKVEIAKKNIDNLNIQKHQILMVGDTSHDYEVASKLGVQCLLYSRGHYAKERLKKNNCTIINDLLEVLHYL